MTSRVYKVVNISSIAGLYGKAGQASYSSAKASLVGLTRTMCKEWDVTRSTSTASPLA
jgi:NAD(P)-dependent dehydrogenase (short-subunit alcohol dehydrogenase family)